MRFQPRTVLFVAIACLLGVAPAWAQTLAEITDLETGQLEVRGFALDESQEVEIEAVVFQRERHARDHDWNRGALTQAWILDSASREVVWSTHDSEPDSLRRGVGEHQATIRLDAGTYEAYYATHPDPYDGDEDDEGLILRLGRSIGRMFSDDDWRGYLHAAGSGDFRIVVRGRGRTLEAGEVEQARLQLGDNALVAFLAVGDDETQSRGFELDQPLEIEVYAVGEVTDDGGYDSGWILDTESRKRVWSFTHDDSEPAGGAAKNRQVRDTLHLPAGRYAAFFVTDGSHSTDHWNALPPYDPSYWGLTLRLSEPGAERYARAFEYSHFPGKDQAIVELTRVGDDEHVSKAFTIERPLKVRIYALGEGTREMHDYGWIADARSRKEVWSMDFRRTEPAGGDSKNRQIDEVIELPAGSYVVAYVTDDSHSYNDWNAAPPTFPGRWGISLFAADESFEPSEVSVYREGDDPSLLARIDRVRDRTHRQREFSLEADSEVSIYALGEGTDGSMYDYGWIENAEGRVIWEMTFRMTERAGGAEKNRFFQGVVELEAGDYTLHYESDGSHSYGDWNASPPRDPEGWGIRVVLVAGG